MKAKKDLIIIEARNLLHYRFFTSTKTKHTAIIIKEELKGELMHQNFLNRIPFSAKLEN